MRLFLSVAILCVGPALGRADDGTAAYAQAVDAVVGIISTTDEAISRGTGVVVAATEVVYEGQTLRGCSILTAEHVLGKGRITVIFPSRDDRGDIIGDPAAYVGLPAEVVATDHDRDLAYLRVRGQPAGVKAIKMAWQVKPGEQVFTIGAGSDTLWHFVSGNVRQVHAGEYRTEHTHVKTRLIEMTTAINPGDSGGPAIDKEGKLVGLNLATQTARNQVHYGVHISEIKEFYYSAFIAEARALIKKQK